MAGIRRLGNRENPLRISPETGRRPGPPWDHLGCLIKTSTDKEITAKTANFAVSL
jgi:hypothetical protein